MRRRLVSKIKSLFLIINKPWLIVIFSVVLAVVAIIAVLFLRASTLTEFEAEVAQLATGAVVQLDSTASNGAYIEFKQHPTCRFPGDPNPTQTGNAYWGAAIAGNGDPVIRHEQYVNKSLSIRRTFWQWDDHATVPNDSLYNTVKTDHAANRLPFVSTKTPPWSEVAAGQHDARIDQLLRELDSYGKPVWLTFHHEPEGGGGSNTPDDPGGAEAWRGMQVRVRQRMSVLSTKNIAFMPVLMAWTFDTRSGRNPSEWWVDGIWDAYMVDHYQDSVNGHIINNVWNGFVSWIGQKGVPYGVGEWGNRGEDAQTAIEMLEFWEWGFNNSKDMIAYTYFDSGLNSPSGSWELKGEPLSRFRDILKDDLRVQRINDL